MKKVISILLALVMVFALAACSSQPQEEAVTINAAVLKGPTGMGMAWLMNENENGTSKQSYNFTVAGAPDEITGKLVSGDLDVAAIPTNAASTLYNKTKGQVVVLAVNTLGVLYVLENGNSVSKVSDLEGKKIVASGQGTTAEFVVNYLLGLNNLTPGENVTIDYVSEHAEAASLALSGKYDLVILPEPFVTSIQKQSADFKVCIDLTQAWNESDAGELVMGAIAARKEFVEKYPNAVAAFLEEYKKSVEFTNENVEEASALIEKAGIISAAVAKSAIPNSHIVFIDSDEMKQSMSGFLKVLFDMQPNSIGGAIPGDDFYYGA